MLILVGGNGADTFVFANADTTVAADSYDTVKDFVSGTDSIDFAGTAGSTNNYSEGGADVANFAAALTAADTALNGTIIYNFQTDGTNGWLFYDADGSANGTTTLDAVIYLEGIDETKSRWVM